MMELTISLNTSSESCLYQQIYEYIKKEIQTGKLLQGEKLPSSRSLADHLRIARSTIDMAYGQLTAEGYISAKPRKGYYVNKTNGILQLDYSKKDMDAVHYQKQITGLQSSILYDFSPHAVSLRNFPLATWKKITRNILVDTNSSMFALGESQGDWELRSTICRYLHSARGVNCTPEQVVLGAGNDYLFLLLEKILGRQVPFAMECPTYDRAYRIFQSFGYPIDLIPMDRDGMKVEELQKRNARIAYVMPSHQYPTGTVMPIGRRLQLLAWAGEQQDRYLIEDDYDSEFRYRGKPIPSLQGVDQKGKVIYLGTFSKAIAPAIRVGYMVLPQKLLQQYRENCGAYACSVSRIDQKIINEFILEGHFERYVNQMKKKYREKHDFLLNELEKIHDLFEVSGENAGLHVLLKSKTQMNATEILQRAAKEGVLLYKMENAPAAFQNTVLLGYGALEKQEMQEGIARIKKAVTNK